LYFIDAVISAKFEHS